MHSNSNKNMLRAMQFSQYNDVLPILMLQIQYSSHYSDTNISLGVCNQTAFQTPTTSIFRQINPIFLIFYVFQLKCHTSTELIVKKQLVCKFPPQNYFQLYLLLIAIKQMGNNALLFGHLHSECRNKSALFLRLKFAEIGVELQTT